MKTAYVLLVNWNGWGDTLECLESVFRSRDIAFRVIVCDNGSRDGSLEHLQAWADGRLDARPSCSGALRQLSSPPLAKPIRWTEYAAEEAVGGGDPEDVSPLVFIRAGENLGFAGGNNLGLRYLLARGDADYVWLLNNDTVVEPQALSRQLTRMQQQPDAAMCGSTLLEYERPAKIQARAGGWYCKWIGLPWHLGQLARDGAPCDPSAIERRMNFVVGASLLVSMEFVRDVGLMCEDYFLYFEELDWALRGKGRYRLVYAPDSRVYHKIGRSIGTRSDPRHKSLVCDFFALRNRLLFTRRYFPWALPSVYLTVVGALLLRVLLGRWQHARMVLALLAGRGRHYPKQVFDIELARFAK